MPPLTAADVDAIAEFRIRSWAREHYVRPSERGLDWHPVALEEMARRDRELQDESHFGRICAVVPLVPDELYHTWHAPQAAVPAPKFLMAVPAIADHDLLAS